MTTQEDQYPAAYCTHLIYSDVVFDPKHRKFLATKNGESFGQDFRDVHLRFKDTKNGFLESDGYLYCKPFFFFTLCVFDTCLQL